MRDYCTVDMLLELEIITPDLAQDILWCCPFCGMALVYRRNLRAQKCSNPLCVGHSAEKSYEILRDMQYVQKAREFYPGVVFNGVGSKTIRQTMRRFNLYNHYAIFNPKIYEGHQLSAKEMELKLIAEMPKEMEFWQLVKYAFVPGLKSESRAYFKQYSSVTEIQIKPPTMSYGMWKDFSDRRFLIAEAESWFAIKSSPKAKDFPVWMTGEFPGYSKRSLFLEALNNHYGDYYHFIDNDKRIEGTKALISPRATNHSKTIKAQKNNIPILTEVEFAGLIYDTITDAGFEVERMK